MPAPRLTVGSITIIPLTDGRFARPPQDLFPHIPLEQWAELRDYLNPDGTLSLNIGSFLIHEDDTWTLVDTGFGGRPDSPGGELLGELENAGLRPDQISRVIMTHLHRDHVGWNTVDRGGQPVPLFERARFVVQRQDWDHFTQPAVKEQQPSIGLCVEPLAPAGLLDLVEGDRALSPGISTILTPGHTPGHQSILVSSGGEKALILGDVAHTAVQVERPDWSPHFDVDPVLSARTRSDVWDRIEQQGLKLCAGHFPYPGLGGLVRVEGKRRWQPLS